MTTKNRHEIQVTCAVYNLTIYVNLSDTALFFQKSYRSDQERISKGIIMFIYIL